jgi:hypothetical protein
MKKSIPRSDRQGWSYKAYGKFFSFRSKKAMKADAERWMFETDAAERERARRVLSGIEAGEHFIDTDAREGFHGKV